MSTVLITGTNRGIGLAFTKHVNIKTYQLDVADFKQIDSLEVTIDVLNLANTGRFIAYDGKEIAW